MHDPLLLIALGILFLAIINLIACMWRGKPTAMTEEETKGPEDWK